MSSSSPQVLIIGCGSIGTRHARTFLATGRFDVFVCDTDPERAAAVASSLGVAAVPDWQAALTESSAITHVLIATPAPLHVAMARTCLAAGKHVLIEKPLALTMAGIDDLIRVRDAADRFAGVAYVQHFAPALQAARTFLAARTFGPIRHVTVNAGQHFPTFRPAYREIYYNDHAQGGGAIQDALTHVANAVEWIVGPTTRLFCDASHQVLEGVTVEDTVNLVAQNGPTRVSYALNQFQAPNELRCDFHAAGGSVRIELHRQHWGVLPLGATAWQWHAAPLEDRDQQFTAQAHAFLDATEGRDHPICTLEEGAQSIRFNLAALQSARELRLVEP
ncbi:Gfo/Idh/MocA family protein [Synoicihabitans lomoniglobus]|uniref:Gfo/Idh/MocA family oxidoreductase n=1 Tax=Synoicihabitans lomoniglobus TaxID=2909285 RepID=A0AAE9ZUQ1_9BACT|nr:Gfo/Idh/MocA family oxidoreductase [Opitutaceae bacterium LMO-M01]WED63671.1 Gfo/Idh/MocA family oxidoreductase [Opitutaceae bacterium LMO-M01]